MLPKFAVKWNYKGNIDSMLLYDRKAFQLHYFFNLFGLNRFMSTYNVRVVRVLSKLILLYLNKDPPKLGHRINFSFVETKYQNINSYEKEYLSDWD